MGSIISRLRSWLWEESPNRMEKEKSKLRIIIVGAGLSGLATAIASALSGHDVAVLESAKELAEVGKSFPLKRGAS